MTNMSRLTKVVILVFGALILATTSRAQTRPPILEQVAKAYGLDSWDNITAIRYTWHAQFPGVDVSRSWTWEPKTNRVTYEGKDKDGKPVTATYLRSQLSSQPENVQKDIDPAFNNDNYWLLFPLHAYWDTSATVTDEGMKKLPIGAGCGHTGPGEVWRRRLHAWRHMGPLHRQRQPRRAICVSPRRTCETERRNRNMDRVQKGWWSGYLNRAPRHRRRQTAAPLDY